MHRVVAAARGDRVVGAAIDVQRVARRQALDRAQPMGLSFYISLRGERRLSTERRPSPLAP